MIGLFVVIAASIFFAMGFIILFGGLRGKLQPDEPRCAKCKYNIRMTLIEHGLQNARCPECGTQLANRNAVVFARSCKRPGAIITGAILIATPVVAVAALILPRMMGINRLFNSPRPTSALIADIANNPSSPQPWIELRSRSVTDAEAEQAIDHFITALKSQSKNQLRTSSHWAENVFEQWDTRGQISQAQYQRLCEAYFQPAVNVTASNRIRTGIPIRGMMDGDPSKDLAGVQVVCALREVTVGTTPLSIKQEDYETTDPDRLSQRGGAPIRFILPNTLPAGDYNVNYVIDFGVLPANTPMTAIDGLPGQKKRWNNPRATWTTTVTLPLKVVRENEHAVDLVTDAARNPVAAGIIRQPRVYARKATKGITVLCQLDKLTGATAVPLCLEKILVIDGKEYSAGTFMYHRTANIGRSGESGNVARFETGLDPAITVADVILRPAPIYAEQFPHLTEIWGNEIIFKNVPLERFDLQD